MCDGQNSDEDIKSSFLYSGIITIPYRRPLFSFCRYIHFLPFNRKDKIKRRQNQLYEYGAAAFVNYDTSSIH